MRYRYYCFIACMLLSAQAAWCQIKRPEIFFSFDTAAWDKPLVTKQYLVVDGQVLKVVLVDTVQKRTTEYIRMDANTYHYTETDSAGVTVVSGKGLLDKKPFKTYKVPIVDSIGNTKGYQTMAFVKFSKTGFWQERIADKLVRYGRYAANKKVGEWLYVTNGAGNLAKKREQYNNGQLVKTENTNLLETKPGNIATTLIGQWGIPRESVMTDDSTFYMKRVTTLNDGGYAGYLIFLANGTCQMIVRGHHGTAKHEGTWKIEANQIVTVSIPKLTATLIFHFVSTDTLSGRYQYTQ